MNLDLHELNLADINKKIIQGETFQMVKICHAFWEEHVRIQRFLKRNRTLEEIWEIRKIRTSIFAYQEILKGLNSLHKYPALLTGVSHQAFHNSEHIGGSPRIEKQAIIDEYKNLIRTHNPLYNGVFWKNTVYDGSFFTFIEALRGKRILTVGQKQVKHFNHFANFGSSAHFFLVEAQDVAWEMEDFLNQLVIQLNVFKPQICLLQLGDTNAFITILQLIQIFPQITFIDLGQVLSIATFSAIEDKAWFKANPLQVYQTICKINPKWENSTQAFSGSVYESLPLKERVKGFKFHLNPKLDAPLNSLNFLDRKKLIKLNLFENIKSQNRYKPPQFITNKRTQFLESLFLNYMGLDKQFFSAVYFENSRQAMEVVLTTYKLNKKSKLKIICSSKNPHDVASRKAKVIYHDFTNEGRLDPQEKESLTKKNWDFLHLSSSYALDETFNSAAQFCEEQKKELLITHHSSLPTATLLHHSPKALHLVSFDGCGLHSVGFGAFIVTSKHKVKPLLMHKRSLSLFNLKVIYADILQLHRMEWLWNLQVHRVKRYLDELKLNYLRFDLNLNRAIPYIACRTIGPIKDLKLPVFNFYSADWTFHTKKAIDFGNQILHIPCNLDVQHFDNNFLKNSLASLGECVPKIEIHTRKKNSVIPMNSLGLKQTHEFIQQCANKLISQAEKNKYINLEHIKKYVLISTPRSGSTLLSLLLHQNGLGWPLEWYNPLFIKGVLALLGLKKISWDEYTKLVLLGSINNETNVFGVKLHGSHYMNLLQNGYSLFEKLNFSNIYYIERKDKLKQAYSLAKAKKTGCWIGHKSNSTDKDGEHIEITGFEVKQAFLKLNAEFSALDTSVKQKIQKTFYYEDLVSNKSEQILSQISEDLQVSIPFRLDFPLRKQTTMADDHNFQQLKNEYENSIVADS